MPHHDKSVVDHIEGAFKEVSGRAQEHLATAQESIADLAHSSAQEIAERAQSGADNIAHSLRRQPKHHHRGLFFGVAISIIVLGLAFRAWSMRESDDPQQSSGSSPV